MRSIGIGLVGFGFAGSTFHAPIIRAVPGLRLAAILARSGDLAQKAYPEVPVVRSMAELLARADVDAVVIATPNTSHYSLARQALEAGRDVVIDKPFAPTLREARELVELARARNRLLTVYQNRRFDGDFRTLQMLLAENVLGRVILFESHFDRYRPQLKQNAWRERDQPGSGVFFDLGPHLIDEALLLFGRPDAITAEVRIEREVAIVDDAFDVVFHYPTMRAVLRASMLAAGPMLRFRVNGSKGTFIKYGLDPQEAALKRGEVPADDNNWGVEPQEAWGQIYLPEDESGKVSVRYVPTQAGDYRGYYANLRDALLGKAELAVTLEQALDVMHALELAKESSRQKRTLPWGAI